MLKTKHISKIIIFIVLVGIGVISYEEDINKTPFQQNRVTKIKVPLKNLDREEVPHELLTLNTLPKTTIEQGDIKGNLFGKFFNNRAEFYVIENPQNTIYSSQTKSITLFYLDSKLCQTKYLLDSNIALPLIKDLGNFSIKGFDLKNREIISSGQPVIKNGKKLAFNKGLDNYQLTWTFGTKEIIYRANSVDGNTQFEYLEKRKDYEQEFKTIERNTF